MSGEHEGQAPKEEVTADDMAHADEHKQGLFKMLSGLVGKDITSMVSLPVWVFEPLSFTQIMAEPMQYSGLLAAAAREADPARRLALIAAFIVAGYSLASRTKKPFNPHLGETFELDFDPAANVAASTDSSSAEARGSAEARAKMGAWSSTQDDGTDVTLAAEVAAIAGQTPPAKAPRFRYFAEQVSHHPPITMARCVADGLFDLRFQMELRSKFRGNNSDVEVVGGNHLTLFNVPGGPAEEHYEWDHLSTTANNILIGTMWIDHHGDITIKNKENNYECRLHLEKSGWLGAGVYRMWGDVVDPSGQIHLKLHGLWNRVVYALPGDLAKACIEAANAKSRGRWFSGLARVASSVMGSGAAAGAPVAMPQLSELRDEECGEMLWHAPTKPFNPTWSWSPYTAALCEVLADLSNIPSSDARIRQDRALLFLNDLDGAGKAKLELEEKQRTDRRTREAAGEEWQLRFHRLEEHQEGEEPVYHPLDGDAGDYWKRRHELFPVSSNNAS